MHLIILKVHVNKYIQALNCYIFSNQEEHLHTKFAQWNKTQTSKKKF